ncbi:hypothetical protein AB0J68_19110 [Micromonospora sp. NPDC049580]|uniref:hypothetical protein n=1 Tax=unclassified Micromonospora TaxID=2617518 RepID=UPI0011990F0D
MPTDKTTPPQQVRTDVLLGVLAFLPAVKRAETRQRKIGEFVAMLARQETIHPQKARPATSP